MLPSGDIFKLPIDSLVINLVSELVNLVRLKVYQGSESERGQVGPQTTTLVDVVHQAVFGVVCSPPCSLFIFIGPPIF